MKKKILKILFACFAFIFIVSLTVFPTFAYDSVNGWYDYSPNMPDLNMFYKREGSYVNTFPRTLTGYVAYEGSTYSSQTQNGYTLSTFKDTSSLGYRFNTFYAVELYWDFIYLPFSASPSSDSFSLDLHLAFDTNSSDSSSDNDVKVRVGYFTGSSIISVKTFTYSFEKDYDNIRDLNIYSILNDSNATALAFLQIGYDFSDKVYGNQKYVEGSLTISNLADWIRLNPYLNATSNLLTSAYDKGFSDAMEQLGGATAEEYYRAGYTNGYNSGYSDGYSVGVNDSTLNNTAYSNGYQIGYAEGYQAYATSSEALLASKYEEGYLAGLDANEGSGYNSGYNAGLLEGFGNGEEYGYNSGYYDGVNEQLQDIGLFDYIGTSLASFFSIPLGEHFTLGGLFAIIVSIPVIIMILKLIAGG